MQRERRESDGREGGESDDCSAEAVLPSVRRFLLLDDLDLATDEVGLEHVEFSHQRIEVASTEELELCQPSAARAEDIP